MKISTALFNQIKAYSEETGIPVEECIEEALSDWVECCMRSRLEAFRQPPPLTVIEQNLLVKFSALFLVPEAS